ncbi:MAG TPA: hypothetical protein VF957_23435 [Bradyrhizobium sp.]
MNNLIPHDATLRAVPKATRTVSVEVRNVYGALKAYPLCINANLFAELAGTKTLTARTLSIAEQLGFAVISTANADWRACA